MSLHHLLTPGTEDALHLFGGVEVQQSWAALYLLEQLLAHEPQIKRIVEIGTAYGGLSLFFGLHMKRRGGDVLTFDIDNKIFPNYDDYNITFRHQDCFLPESIEEIRLFTLNHPALLFCDGGNKPKEFLTFTPLMKPKDFIMVHDYTEFGAGNVPTEMSHNDLAKSQLEVMLDLYYCEGFLGLGTTILSLRRKA